ncbi:CBS domain-containing protein [candidate division KSB1 bacterium]|nr:CBS domain-containing protein [candidate division KSB1 bacterium]
MAKIDKIMDTSVPTLKKEAKISDAAKLIANKPHGCVVIVEGKKPIGKITESDIVRKLISKKTNSKEKVTKIMNSPITTMHPNTKLEKAIKIIDTKVTKIAEPIAIFLAFLICSKIDFLEKLIKATPKRMSLMRLFSLIWCVIG